MRPQQSGLQVVEVKATSTWMLGATVGLLIALQNQHSFIQPFELQLGINAFLTME